MSDATHKAAAMSEPRYTCTGEWLRLHGCSIAKSRTWGPFLADRLNRLDAAEALIREMAGALRDLLTASWDDSERHNAAAEAAVAKADAWLAQEGGGRAD